MGSNKGDTLDGTTTTDIINIDNISFSVKTTANIDSLT